MGLITGSYNIILKTNALPPKHIDVVSCSKKPLTWYGVHNSTPNVLSIYEHGRRSFHIIPDKNLQYVTSHPSLFHTEYVYI